MQKILVSKDGFLVWLVVFALAGGFASRSRPVEAQGASEIETGAVIEEVGAGSALEKAGLRTGDIVLSWERLPSPLTNSQGARGTIDSVFDWMWLKVEQAPRGTVKLIGQRSAKIKVFEVAPGEWNATVRAKLPKEMLADYAKGKELIEAEELETGITLWHRVDEAAKNQTADEHLRCWLLLQIGDAWVRARQWEKAHGAYRPALEAARDPRSRVQVWRAIGLAYSSANAFEKARQAFVSAQEIRESTWGKNLTLARGLNDLGDLDLSQGRLNAARGYLLGALEIRQKQAPGSLDVASSLNKVGSLAEKRGNLDQAAEYYERSLEIARKWAPSSLFVATSLHRLAGLAYARGNLDRMAEFGEEALEIRQKLAPGSLDMAWSMNSSGLLAAKRGDLDQAIECYEKALEIQQKLAPGSLAVAASLNNLGLSAQFRGDLDRATEYFEEALEIQQELAPGSLGVAGRLGNLGLVAASCGDSDRATEYYEEALEIQQRWAPGSLGVALSLNNLGYRAAERGDLDRAAEYYEGALKIWRKLAPGSLHQAMTLRNLGILASDRSDLDRATEYYERALKIQQKLAPGSSAEAITLHALGILRRKENQPRPALRLFHQALQALENQISKLGGSRDLQANFRAHWAAVYHGTIRLLLELHQAEEAFHTLERSRAQSFLAQLSERDLVFSDVPEELQRQRRRTADRYDQTQTKIARLKPREQAQEIKALQDQLQELRWEYDDITEKIIKASPWLGALRYPQPLDFTAAREALDPGTVMLSYSVGEESTEIFVLTSNGAVSPPLDPPKGTATQVKTIAIGEQDLRSTIQTWNELILTARPGDETGALHSVRVLGKDLYKQLIEPVADAVAGSQRLLIIPDGPLHVLPWGALIRETVIAPEGHTQADGADEMYLAEWKPLHIALSATVYAQLKQSRHPRPKPSEEPSSIRLTAFGDPLFPGKEVSHGDFRVRSAVDRGLFDGWDSLPHTRREVEQIAALYKAEATRTYLGAEATEEAVKAVGHGARILHLAAHGHLDDRSPLDSAVVLTIPLDPGTGRDNGLLQVWEIFERVRLDADLVVLSACASAQGEEQRGEGLIGLTRAFQYAGARSVMASLWNVQDQATAELMVRFHRHLQEGLTKDEALRAAQLELIRGEIKVEDEDGEIKVRDYSAPYYWAPFQIYGDWR